MQDNRTFNTRGFTSFVVMLTFLAMVVSGTMLYLSPRGSTARWTDWSVLGLGKFEWIAVHTTMSVLFILATAVHLYFNWTFLSRYVKDTVAKGVRSKREFALAALLVGAVFVGTQAGIPPLSTVVEGRDRAKAYWEERDTRTEPAALADIGEAEHSGWGRSQESNPEDNSPVRGRRAGRGWRGGRR